MPESRGEELAHLIKDAGGEIAVLMFLGRHEEAQFAAEVMVAQGELLLAFYQEDMSPEEIDAHRSRLASIEIEKGTDAPSRDTGEAAGPSSSGS